jgi:hypothetical protein
VSATIQIGVFTTHHHYFHIDGLTDLTPTRDQAERRRADKRHPESSVIHFHKKDESCFGRDHESYMVGTDEVIKVRPVAVEVVRS